jgi:hypothetical protein
MDRSLSNFAMDRTLIDRMASSAGAVAPWRAVAAVALLSVLFVLALAGNAHATLTPDGLLAGESGESHFGQSVALAADGNTALVGAPTADGEAGTVSVFTRTGSTWTQQSELTPNGGEEIGNGGFGSSIALSADGSTAVVSGPATTAASARRGCSRARKVVSGASREESSRAAERKGKASSAGAWR